MISFTTSWDDGDPDDLRVAEMLATAHLKGTFYICRDYDGRPRLSDAEIRELDSMPGMEVGSHTLSHPDLRRLGQAELRGEVFDSRNWLSDILGRDVDTFCYPKGLHNRRVVEAVRSAGYRLARTTRSGNTRLTHPDAFRMPTTLQLYPHKRSTQIRHSVKEWDASGALALTRVYPWSRSASRLIRSFARGQAPMLIHVWGHSWELRHRHLWDELAALIAAVSRWNPTALTNSELIT